MDVDDFLKNIGQFGLFQKRILAMFFFMFFPITYQTLIMVFVAYEPPWMCTANGTACLQPNATGREIFSTATKPLELYQRRCSLNRSDWKFADHELYEGPHTSIVTEFDLVCDRSSYGWMANAILFLGWAVGAFVFGAISDKYGRKIVLFPSVALIILLTFGMSFSKAIWVVIFFRFFVGVFEGGSGLPMFVLAAELVGPAKRALSATLVWFYFSLALMLLALKAFFIRDWRVLCIVGSIPFIFVLIFWKFVPESVRWMLVNGHKEKALETLKETARVNKREFPDCDLRVPHSPPNKGCLELFASKRLAIMTLIQCYAWFVNGMVYYGVSMSAGELGGSIYLNFVLTSLVEIPANYLVIDNCNRFGRKKTVVWHFVAGAIACVVVSFIPAGTDNIGNIAGRVTGGTLGKLFITVSFNAIYVFSAELFPTVVRNSGMGLMIITSRIGAATAPFIVQMTRINAILPFAVMGIAAVLAAIACWFLPETKGKPTLEVIGDDVKPMDNEEVLLEEKEEKNANLVVKAAPEDKAQNNDEGEEKSSLADPKKETATLLDANET